MSVGVILFMLGMTVFFIRFFVRNMERDERKASKK